MATRISPPQNKTYYINPAYLTFNENSGYGANLIQVSASSSCYISVYDTSNGIGYSDADRNYQRWKVTAYNNKFPDDRAYYIYARLDQNGNSAMIVYSKEKYNVDGSTPDGSVSASDTYYYIRIGDVTEVKSSGLREITYDTGYLESKQGEADANELNEMWELDKYSFTSWLIKAKKWLASFTVKGTVTLIGGLIFKNGDQDKLVEDVKRSLMSDAEVQVSDTTIPTTLYVSNLIEDLDDRFLRKDKDDRSKGKIASDVGFEVGNFKEGTLGSGAAIYEKNGSTYTETDYLKVRKKATFTNITVQELKHVGGEIVLSPAAMVCSLVEETGAGYKCFFEKEDEDGHRVYCEFSEGDQARMQTFNMQDYNRYYWRLVTEVNENDGYIVLSKTDCDAGSDAPKSGDNIVQLGNRNDLERQAAIILSAYGSDAPSYKQYRGIDSYSLEGKQVTKLSPYGNELTGKLTIESGSTGWENMEGLEDAIKAATPEGYQEFVDSVIQGLEGLQKQVDGAVDAFFFDYDPALTNYPASEWTEEEKETHLNDTFTNNSTGDSWRWGLKDGAYGWIYIEDTATKKALATASQAQDTADGKRRVFTETPYPPYDAGDLWAGGESLPLMRCIQSRESGSYMELDWEPADDSHAYADAVKVQLEQSVVSVKEELDGSIAKVENASQTYTDEAKAALQKSLEELDKAKAGIDDVYTKTISNGLIEASELRAKAAAEEVAKAAQELAEANVKAWADGEIDAAEKAAIASAETKLAEAKAELGNAMNEMNGNILELINSTKSDLDNAIAATKTAANNYSDDIKVALQTSIDELERTKAHVDSVYTRAQTDGAISEREEAAVLAAKAYSDAAVKLADEELRVWADGKISAEETARIEEARANLAAARQYAEQKADEAFDAAVEEMENLEAGKNNLLRNSGFFGDYTTASLNGDSVLNDTSEMYSPSLKYWTVSGAGAVASEESESESGKKATIYGGGAIIQTLFDGIAAGENYICSFRAKGQSVLMLVGGYAHSFTLTSSWNLYVVKFAAVSTARDFSLTATGNCDVCEIQLERGTIRSAWGMSPLDNKSDAAKIESYTYLKELMKASTDIEGAVINTGALLLGSEIDDEGHITDTTAGVSGVYNDDNSVAFWSGGDYEKAIYTANTYLNNPNYNPTEAELANMAKCVITHGGRAILNDVILRGYIHALGGLFKGAVEIAGGRILLNEDGSGQLANGTIHWTANGVQYRRAPERIEWIRLCDFYDNLNNVSLTYGHYMDLTSELSSGVEELYLTSSVEDGTEVLLKMNIQSTSQMCITLYGEFLVQRKTYIDMPNTNDGLGNSGMTVGQEQEYVSGLKLVYSNEVVTLRFNAGLSRWVFSGNYTVSAVTGSSVKIATVSVDKTDVTSGITKKIAVGSNTMTFINGILISHS